MRYRNLCKLNHQMLHKILISNSIPTFQTCSNRNVNDLHKKTLTAATIRVAKAVKITQRSCATRCHIRTRACNTVTGLANNLTSTSSEKLHQLPPGRTVLTEAIHRRTRSNSSAFRRPLETSGAFWMENPLIEEADLRGGRRTRFGAEGLGGLGRERRGFRLLVVLKRWRLW